jgi:hypothetical protein
MDRLTKTFLILVLCAACSTTTFARQDQVPPIFPSTLRYAIDRNAQQSDAPVNMTPVRQISTPSQPRIDERPQLQQAQVQPTQLPGQITTQPPQSSPLDDFSTGNSTVILGPPPQERMLQTPADQALNQSPEQPEFGTVMTFPAQNDPQPNVAQSAQPNIDPAREMVGQLMPPRNSTQNRSQPRSPENSPYKLASSPYPPNRHLTRPKPGVYIAPKSQPPELTEPPPEPNPPQPTELAERQATELAQPRQGKFVLPKLYDFPPLGVEVSPSKTPRVAAPQNQVLETTVIGPETLVRDVPEEFEIVVLNISDQTATNIVIQMDVPEDLTLTELDRNVWLDSDNRTVSWAIDELPSGTKEVIRYSSVSGRPGRHKQTISVGMQNSFQGETSFESIVIQNDDYETIEHPGFEDDKSKPVQGPASTTQYRWNRR